MTVDTIQTGTIVPASPVQPLAMSQHTTEALRGLSEWVAAASQASQLVTPLVETAFIPDAYRPKVDPRATDLQRSEARQIAIANATAAVLQGITLGLDPLTSLQQIYIVHGRPGMYTKIKVALAQSKGHEIWTEDLSDSRAVVAGRRKGSQDIQRVTVTMEQARKAGWAGKNDNYNKTPQDMLWARAAGRVADRIAADVLMGIASVEDIQDEAASEAPAPAQRTIRPRQARAITPAPVGPSAPAQTPVGDDLLGYEDQPAAAATAAEPQPLDPGQWRRINARFVELEVVGEGQTAHRLRVISHIVGREISRGGELSADEGQLVLDKLAGESGPRVLDAAFGRTPASEPIPAAPDGDDLLGDGDDYDPTTEAGFGEMDGGEAAGEELLG
jgi:hypothetical protein